MRSRHLVGVAAIGGAVLAGVLAIRRWQLRWGATNQEASGPLPGDDLISDPDTIVPEWQDVRIGDQIRLAPQVALTVARLEQGKSLVLRGDVTSGRTPPPYDFTWAFALKDEPGGATRLLVRERYAYTRPWAQALAEPVEAVSFVMTQKMLRGIKARAERCRW